MDRRGFIFATGAVLLSSAQKLRTLHHVVSAQPLFVESELWPLFGRYTRLEDFYIRNHFPPSSATSALAIEGEVNSLLQRP
jgi:hypothetical protein